MLSKTWVKKFLFGHVKLKSVAYVLVPILLSIKFLITVLFWMLPVIVPFYFAVGGHVTVSSRFNFNGHKFITLYS